MKHDPKMVEAMARAAYRSVWSTGRWTWLTEARKDLFFREMRAALDAQAEYLKRKKKEKRRG